MAGDGARPLLPGIDEPPATRYDVALLDLDGVVYLGGHPIRGAAAAAPASARARRVARTPRSASV